MDTSEGTATLGRGPGLVHPTTPMNALEQDMTDSTPFD
jgi:hypothetical protein